MSTETAVPKAVAEAARRADEQIAALAAGNLPAPNDATPAPDVAPAPPPAAQPPAPPAPPAANAGDDDSSSETWKHRYLSLQGMFNQKLPAAQREAREAALRAEAAENAVAALNAQLAQAKTQAAPLITAEDTEVYGEELLDVMARKARAELMPAIEAMQVQVANYEQRNAQLESLLSSQVQQVHKAQAHSFYDQLDAGNAQWETINRDPQFLAWLNEFDISSGKVRSEVLRRYFEAKDAGGVLFFFNTWAQQNQPRKTNTVPAELIEPPRRTAGTSAPADRSKRNWARTEIQQFYRDRIAGKYRGRDAESAQIERDIFAAQADGRIVD